MKKLLLSLSMLAIVAITSNAFGQADSGKTPAQGSTHTYQITANGSNTYSWKVTIGDMSTDASSDVTFAPASATGASVNITWSSTASTTQSYYVHVIETDATTGCTNEKVMKVNPIASQFYLAITSNYATTSCYYDDAVTVGVDGSGNPTYDHGTATISYTITPNGTGNTSTGYSFSFSNVIKDYASNVATLPTDFSILSAQVTAGSGAISGFTAGTGGGTVTVSDNSPVTVTFKIDHVKTYANEQNVAVSEFTSVVSISGGVTNNGVTDNGSGTYSDNFKVTRPHTTDIVTD